MVHATGETEAEPDVQDALDDPLEHRRRVVLVVTARLEQGTQGEELIFVQIGFEDVVGAVRSSLVGHLMTLHVSGVYGTTSEVKPHQERLRDVLIFIVIAALTRVLVQHSFVLFRRFVRLVLVVLSHLFLRVGMHHGPKNRSPSGRGYLRSVA